MGQSASSNEASRANGLYYYGQTIITACTADPRFHYVMYVPPGVADGRKTNLIVAVHGTTRTSAIEFRDAFSEFGRWNDCAILCPIFPANVCGDGNRSGYKYLQEQDIRYDQVLIAMVDDVAQQYRQDWWVGIRNLDSVFGISFDRDAFARIPMHMIVGGADLETWEITHAENSKYWMPGANSAGATRPERLASLKRSFESAGATVTMEVLPGVSHERTKALDNVKSFFHAELTKLRAREVPRL